MSGGGGLPRWAEAGAAALGLAALAPLLLALAAAIRLDSPGPALFCQERIGRHGRPFRLYKLRTMHCGAAAAGAAVTVGDDPRVTRVGRWLRRHKLDELPQLINVVRGEMGLVGPRPEVPGYVALYTPVQRQVLEARPGLTDPASLRYADEQTRLAAYADPEAAYREVIMPAKLRRNRAYLRRRTVGSDLRVLLSTLRALGG